MKKLTMFYHQIKLEKVYPKIDKVIVNNIIKFS